MPTIEAAIVDLGGVLMDVCVERTVRAWAETTGLAPEDVDLVICATITADNVLPATVPGNIPVSLPPPAKGTDAAPGMELGAAALALALVAMLARRRRRGDRR